MKVVSLGFESTDNSKEFAVINVVVSFCMGKRLGKIWTGMPLSIGIGLEKDGT